MPNKSILAWGGFVDGKLYVMSKKERPDEPQYNEPRYAVFPTKRDARRAYRDVRRIRITVVKESR